MSVAYHEAGHAVIAHLLGVPFELVDIGHDAETATMGRMILSVDADGTAPDAAMVVLLAGEAAESLATGCHDWIATGPDIRRAAAIALRGCETGAEARACCLMMYYRALGVLQRRDVWPAVVAVATMLEAVDHLFADQCVAIIDGAAGERYAPPARHPITAIGESEALAMMTGIVADWEQSATG